MGKPEKRRRECEGFQNEPQQEEKRLPKNSPAPLNAVHPPRPRYEQPTLDRSPNPPPGKGGTPRRARRSPRSHRHGPAGSGVEGALSAPRPAYPAPAGAVPNHLPYTPADLP